MTRLEKLIALKNKNSKELYWEVASEAESFGVSFSVQLDRMIAIEEKALKKTEEVLVEKKKELAMDANMGVECIRALGVSTWDERNNWLLERGYGMSSIYRAVNLGLLKEEIVGGRAQYTIVQS